MHLYLGQRFSNLKAPSKSPGRLKKEHWASAPEFQVGRDGWGWEDPGELLAHVLDLGVSRGPTLDCSGDPGWQ